MFSNFGMPYNLTATGAVGRAGAQLRIIGFYVNSTSSGTIIFNSPAGTAVTGTITPGIGFHPLWLDCPNGCAVTVGGTLNVTIIAQ